MRTLTLGFVLALAALATGARPAQAADDTPAGKSALIEVAQAEPIEKLLAEPGVVLVDCFADW